MNLKPTAAAPSSATTGPAETPRTCGDALISAAIVGHVARKWSFASSGMVGTMTATKGILIWLYLLFGIGEFVCLVFGMNEALSEMTMMRMRNQRGASTQCIYTFISSAPVA